MNACIIISELEWKVYEYLLLVPIPAEVAKEDKSAETIVRGEYKIR
jgi:hypothetical protein